MEKMNNCIFCRSPRVEVVEKQSRGPSGRLKFSYYGRCLGCKARGPSFGCFDKPSEAERSCAVAGWNRERPVLREG
jgi:hypothetical protein